MSDKTYDGWSTYETRQANLWIVEVMEKSADLFDAGLLAELLHDIAGSPSSGLAADIFNAWLGEVNCGEIIEHYQVYRRIVNELCQ